MKTNLIIFDFDGVFVDSKKLYVDIVHGSLIKLCYVYPKSHIAKSLGPKIEETLDNIGKFDKKIKLKLKKEINDWIAKKTKQLKLCPYAKQTLRDLKQQQFRMVLLTNSAKKYVTLFLRKNKIDKYFNKILCTENFDTKEKAIKQLTKQYKIKIKDVIYVADTGKDVRIAKAVGCKIIIVLACSWNKAIFKKSKRKPKFLIKDLSKLKNAIQNISI